MRPTYEAHAKAYRWGRAPHMQKVRRVWRPTSLTHTSARWLSYLGAAVHSIVQLAHLWWQTAQGPEARVALSRAIGPELGESEMKRFLPP